MADHAHEGDAIAGRTTRLLSHLDGALDASMLDAIQGAWSMLERTATDSPAHARAVRSRLLWESMSPGALAEAVASPVVHDLVPIWDEDGTVVHEDVAPAGLDAADLADAA